MSSPPATLKDLYTAPAPRHQPSPVPVPPLGSIHARPRPAFNRLAPVLSMLARTSQKPMKELSERTRCSASYLSRILNGERIPTWELTERFARACGADPAVLRSVWETERLRSNSPLLETEDDDEGDDEDPHRAGARLLRALRTLHVRAGQPTAYDIATAGKHQLTVTLITAVLEGIRFPGWRDLVSLLNVLGGDISYFQPLWEAAVRPATPPTETTPAAPSPHPEPSSPPQDPSCGHPIVSPDASGSSTRGQHTGATSPSRLQLSRLVRGHQLLPRGPGRPSGLARIPAGTPLSPYRPATYQRKPHPSRPGCVRQPVVLPDQRAPPRPHGSCPGHFRFS
ncbi:helix-turn-helix transcriptional regulator [Streptomyces klenkii]|uniref:helix-turn-helix domain-containing protein n=1 Tax=Streptomyces klenkii TaxID=1420899 RepID=UPI0033DA9479